MASQISETRKSNVSRCCGAPTGTYPLRYIPKRARLSGPKNRPLGLTLLNGQAVHRPNGRARRCGPISGAHIGEIADATGLSRQAVYRIKDDPAAAEAAL